MEILVISLFVVLPVVVIVYLCYTWMQSTRASQRRTEAQNQRVIELLEEQNRLLIDLRDRRL